MLMTSLIADVVALWPQVVMVTNNKQSRHKMLVMHQVTDTDDVTELSNRWPRTLTIYIVQQILRTL